MHSNTPWLDWPDGAVLIPTERHAHGLRRKAKHSHGVVVGDYVHGLVWTPTGVYQPVYLLRANAYMVGFDLESNFYPCASAEYAIWRPGDTLWRPDTYATVAEGGYTYWCPSGNMHLGICGVSVEKAYSDGFRRIGKSPKKPATTVIETTPSKPAVKQLRTNWATNHLAFATGLSGWKSDMSGGWFSVKVYGTVLGDVDVVLRVKVPSLLTEVSKLTVDVLPDAPVPQINTTTRALVADCRQGILHALSSYLSLHQAKKCLAKLELRNKWDRK